MNVDEDFVYFQVKFQSFGIHQLLAFRELFQKLEKDGEDMYWKLAGQMAKDKQEHDAKIRKMMVALEMEISHVEKQMERENDRTKKKLKERRDKFLGSV